MEPWTDKFANKAHQIQVMPTEKTWQKLHARLNQRQRTFYHYIRTWHWVAAASLILVLMVGLRIFIADSAGLQVVGELEPMQDGDSFYMNTRPSIAYDQIDPQAMLLPNKDPQRQEKYARIMADLEDTPADIHPVAVALGQYQMEMDNSRENEFNGLLELIDQTTFNLQVRYDGQKCIFLRIPGQPNLFVQQAPSNGLFIIEVLSPQRLVFKWYDEQQNRFLEGQFRLNGAS